MKEVTEGLDGVQKDIEKMIAEMNEQLQPKEQNAVCTARPLSCTIASSCIGKGTEGRKA